MPSAQKEQLIDTSSQHLVFLERMAHMASSAVTDNVGGLFRPFRQAPGRQLRPLTQSLKGASASELRGQRVHMNMKTIMAKIQCLRGLQTSLKPKVWCGSCVCTPVHKLSQVILASTYRSQCRARGVTTALPWSAPSTS